MKSTPSSSPISRRKLLAALPLAGAVLGGGAGCGSGGGKTAVRYWNGFTGPDGRTMLRLVKRFNDENPDVQVVMQRTEWGTHYNKLFVAGLGGRAPELCVIHSRTMQRFVQAGFLRPNDDLIAGGGSTEALDVADLDPNVWKRSEFEGRHYGLPLDVHTMGMYCNRRLFQQAGLADSQGNIRMPTERAEFLDALQRMTRPGASGQPGQWGYVFANWEANAYSFMRQFGGEFFTEDHSRCVMHNEGNVDALQFCVDLIRRYRVAPPPENFDAWIGFRQGKVGITAEGIYMLADLQKQQDLDYTGAPIPLVGDQRATFADSHNLCLRADLKGPELAATWRFVKFLSDNSLDWAEGGQIPVRRSLRATPRFSSMELQSAFARQIPYVSYLPRMTFILEFLREFNLAIEMATRGRMSPPDALKAAEARINGIIAREQRTAHWTPEEWA
ncbi:MAG TPA: ABC transporter substrate-binding protein [Armatimonadota bacterium]|nr:ABC transporter substrate-binding protein [Armatimonadota bacterium]